VTSATGVAGSPGARRRWPGSVVATCLALSMAATAMPAEPAAAAGRERDRARGKTGHASSAPREPAFHTCEGPAPAWIRAEARHPFLSLETAYQLDVDLRWQPARLAVRAGIEVCNRGDERVDAVHLSVLARGFGEFRLRDLRVGGERVAPSFPSPASMLVPIARGLEPGHREVIQIDYIATPTRQVRSSLEASLSKAEGLFRVSDWFPLVSGGHGLRLPGDSQFSGAATRIRLDLVTDRPLVVAAPGRRARREVRRHVYTIEGARDLGFLVARRLRSATMRTRDGVTVEAFARRVPDAKRMVRLGADAMEVYDDAYGPYPWRRLVLAPTPRRLSGHETPGLVFVGSGWVEGLDRYERRFLRLASPERRVTASYVVRHEVAHQWFYALVGNDQLGEPWVDEALAEFSGRHFFELERPFACARRPVSSSVYDFPNRRSDLGCDGYTETVYRRGAVMVEGVRRLMGDQPFFEALRELVAANRFGVIGGQDVIDAWRGKASAPGLLDAYLSLYLEAPAVSPGAGPPLEASTGTRVAD
jgi:hypothetical protein